MSYSLIRPPRIFVLVIPAGRERDDVGVVQRCPQAQSAGLMRTSGVVMAGAFS